MNPAFARWETWAKAALAAAIGGTATAGVDALSNGRFDMKHLGRVALGGALSGLFLYLKQSPLPASSVTVTATKTVELTKE